MATQGSYPLSDGTNLPNVTVAFPGEHWSNRKASGSVVPGEAVVPVNSGGSLYTRKAVSGDATTQLAIALRTVDVPDTNSGSIYNDALGPNEIKNRTINHGEYVHSYYSGAFHLTLVAVGTYAPGDLIGWNPSATRPTGKSGTGAWDKDANCPLALRTVFEVQEWRPYSAGGNEGILTVRSLRGQF